MKKGVLFVLIVMVCGAVAALGIPNATVSDGTGQYHVTADDAARAAYGKLSELGKAGDFSITSLTEICSDEGVLLWYLAELQPRGYMLISPDMRLPPVGGYSFIHTCRCDDSRRNIPLRILRGGMHQRLTEMSRMPAEAVENNRRAWERYLDDVPESKATLLFRQWPPEGTTPTGGWVETTWHQNEPYNMLCPIDKSTGKRSVAGCPAVTMAQILNYHATTCDVAFNDTDDYHHTYGANQYWIDDDHNEYLFPSFPELNEYLTALQQHYRGNITPSDEEKAALTFACGVAAQQVYTSEVSGTFGVDQARQAYLRFGIEGIELLHEHDGRLYERLMTNMVEALPAHLAVVVSDWSAGHNLIVDGYNTDNYYHLNFGWGGVWDGWYLLPEGIPFDLTVVEGVIVDIMVDTSSSTLKGSGVLVWNDIAPGETATGNFTIENIGAAGSTINWTVAEWPSWGTWSFEPAEGRALTPEDGPVTIHIHVTAPDEKREDFSGQVTVIDENNASNRCTIQVALSTPFEKISSPILRLIREVLHQFPLLKWMLGWYDMWM